MTSLNRVSPLDGALRNSPTQWFASVPAEAVRDASTLKTVKAWDSRNRFVWEGELRVARDANGKNVFWLVRACKAVAIRS